MGPVALRKEQQEKDSALLSMVWRQTCSCSEVRRQPPLTNSTRLSISAAEGGDECQVALSAPRNWEILDLALILWIWTKSQHESSENHLSKSLQLCSILSHIVGARKHGTPGRPILPPTGRESSPRGSHMVSIQMTQSFFPICRGITQAMEGKSPAPHQASDIPDPQAPLGLPSSF